MLKENPKLIKEELLKKYGDPETLDDLARIVISEINKVEKLLAFSWEIKYSPKIPATHSCPHNGISYFGWDNSKRITYPGYVGRVKIEYKKNL
jgi:hypothetical protein